MKTKQTMIFFALHLTKTKTKNTIQLNNQLTHISYIKQKTKQKKKEKNEIPQSTYEHR